MKIQPTRNYDKFIFDETNRPIDTGNARSRKLRDSMKRYGWLAAYPAHCVTKGAYWKIKDGQHRYMIAKELSLPVLFVVTERDDISIPEINIAQKSWSMDDFVGSYAQQGNVDYQELETFAQAYNMPAVIAASLMRGAPRRQSNIASLIQQGGFKITDREFADKVDEIVDTVTKKYTFISAGPLAECIAQLLMVEQFDAKQLLDRMETNPHLIVKPRGGRSALMELLEKVYNYKSQSRVPLVFLTDEFLRKRQSEGYKKGLAAALEAKKRQREDD